MNTETEVLEFIEARAGDLPSPLSVYRLENGLLNFVWRIRYAESSLILKSVKPHLASRPDIGLSDARFDMETGALEAFSPGGYLESLASDAVRPPRLIRSFDEERVLLEEDAGDVPDLSVWLSGDVHDGAVRETATTVGAFVGSLHAQTAGDESLRERFCNSDVQQVRYRLQYAHIGKELKKWHQPSWRVVDRTAIETGERFLSPGVCLTMGDLWPRSILVSSGAVRLIDWEFCHFGHPAQDVGHLCAHLWMLGHVGRNEAGKERSRLFARRFLTAYLEAAGDFVGAAVSVDEFDRLTRSHFASEILARTIGHFVRDYLYGTPSVRPKRLSAIDKAVSLMLDDRFSISGGDWPAYV